MNTTSPPQAENPSADHTQDVDDDAILEPAKSSLKKYHLYYTASRLDAGLHLGSSASPATYYFETHMSLTSPQLLLRGGDSKSAPMVNFARLRTTSRHILLGGGDYHALVQARKQHQIAWEELRRDKNMLRRSDYRFSTAKGSGGGSGTGCRRAEYRWCKDRGKALKTVYDSLDEDGRIVARLLSGGVFNWKKGGEIDVLEGVDEGLEGYLIMSALAIWVMEAFEYQSLLQGYGSSNEKNSDAGGGFATACFKLSSVSDLAERPHIKALSILPKPFQQITTTADTPSWL
ncbi:hypothetical protein DL770_006137 [Monosporascus sp. CRB-9-2]|nr:hypothetical protein DL770_006137 [Monosporascus sp. CRB-9-2]